MSSCKNFKSRFHLHHPRNLKRVERYMPHPHPPFSLTHKKANAHKENFSEKCNITLKCTHKYSQTTFPKKNLYFNGKLLISEEVVDLLSSLQSLSPYKNRCQYLVCTILVQLKWQIHIIIYCNIPMKGHFYLSH